MLKDKIKKNINKKKTKKKLKSTLLSKNRIVFHEKGYNCIFSYFFFINGNKLI
jgi:hypothetical protein